METLKVRMEQQMRNAKDIAQFLNTHDKVAKVYYLGLLEKGTREHQIYSKQYTSPGAMISFDIKGGEKECFQFLNHLNLIKLAVSLGGTESLAQHPASMTHIGIDPQERLEMGVTEKMVRISVGIENAADLIYDISTALNQVEISEKVKEAVLS